MKTAQCKGVLYSKMNYIVSFLHARRTNITALTRTSLSDFFKKEMQTEKTMKESGGKRGWSLVLQDQVKENNC